MYVVLVLLNIADAESTRFALREGVVELNPIIAYLIERFGFNSIYAFKLSVLAFFGFWLYRAARRLQAWARPRELTLLKGGLFFLVIAYSVIVIANCVTPLIF
jgi:hypothetical protein